MARSCSHLHLEAGWQSKRKRKSYEIFEIDMQYAPASIPQIPKIPKMAITQGNVQKCMYRISCSRSVSSLFAKLKDSLVPLLPFSFFVFARRHLAAQSVFRILSMIKHCQKCSKSPQFQVPYSFSLSQSSLLVTNCDS